MGPLFDYMDIQKQIEGFVQECLASAEYSDCFLIEVKVSPKGKVQVFVDGDEGITLQRCKSVSRQLEQKIDTAGLFGGRYALEVSSPGTDRPLLMARQYPKHIGRKLKVSLIDGSQYEGTLTDLRDDVLYLGVANGKQAEEKTITIDSIKESLVQISFK